MKSRRRVKNIRRKSLNEGQGKGGEKGKKKTIVHVERDGRLIRVVAKPTI